MRIAPPQSIADITPAWLTQTLRDAGCINRAQVIAQEIKIIGVAVGFLDGLARILLRYDSEEAGAPASVIVKMPAADAAFRETGDSFHAYEREIRFYQEVAPRTPIRLARCYYNPAQRSPGDYVIVMEDLNRLTPGDQVKGVSTAQARAAVQTIARFHARWWDSPELEALDWMPTNNGDFAPRYRQTWSHFVEEAGPLLPKGAIELGHRVGEHFELLQDRLAQPPRTICHWDFRADNIMFDDPAGPEPVVVLDWQLAIRSKGIFDVARLIAGSVRHEDRLLIERDLLALWHQTLLAHGVKGYAFDQALWEYKSAVLYGTVSPVIFFDLGGSAGPRGAALMAAMAERYFDAIVELDAASVLPD